MNKEELIFPVTPDDFTAYQTAGIGRELTADEHEIMEAWVPVFNDYYDAGRSDDRKALISVSRKMGKFIAAQGPDSAAGNFLQSMRWWIIYAWDQGSKKWEVTA